MARAASEMVDLYIQAEADILAYGQASAISGAFGGRSLTTADLAEVRRGRVEWERRKIADAMPAGRFNGGRVAVATFR